MNHTVGTSVAALALLAFALAGCGAGSSGGSSGDSDPVLVQILMTPDHAVVGVSQSAQFGARGYFSDGSFWDIDLAWEVGDPGIATISVDPITRKCTATAGSTLGVTDVIARAVSDPTIFGSAPFTVSSDPPMPPVITPGTLANGSVGISYTPADFSYTQGSGINEWWEIAAGAFPPGLYMDWATGLLMGTPTTEGTYVFSLMVSDTFGYSDPVEFTIIVDPYDAAGDVGVGGGGGGGGGGKIQQFAAN